MLKQNLILLILLLNLFGLDKSLAEKNLKDNLIFKKLHTKFHAFSRSSNSPQCNLNFKILKLLFKLI